MGIRNFFKQDFSHHLTPLGNKRYKQNRENIHLVVDMLTFAIRGSRNDGEIPPNCLDLFMSLKWTLDILKNQYCIDAISLVVDGDHVTSMKEFAQSRRRQVTADAFRRQLEFVKYKSSDWYPELQVRLMDSFSIDSELVRRDGEADEHCFKIERSEGADKMIVLSSDSDLLLRLQFQDRVYGFIRKDPTHKLFLFEPVDSNVEKTRMLKYALLAGTDFFGSIFSGNITSGMYLTKHDSWIELLEEQNYEELAKDVCWLLKNCLSRKRPNSSKLDEEEGIKHVYVLISCMLWFLFYITDKPTPLVVAKDYSHSIASNVNILRLALSKPDFYNLILNNIKQFY